MENLGSGLAAVVMIGLAIYIGLRSLNQLTDPHPVSYPILGAEIAGIAAIIALSLGIYKYVKGKKSKMGSVKLEAFNTIKDGTASGLTVVALLLASQGIYIADAIVGFVIAGIIVVIGITAIKESSLMLIDACDDECVDKSYVVKKIAEKVEGVQKAHVVRLRRSGPVLQGELEITVPQDITVSKFNKIKKEIKAKIKEAHPDIQRLTITNKDDESE